MAQFSPSWMSKNERTQGEAASHDFRHFIIVFSPHDMEIDLFLIKIEKTFLSLLIFLIY
jgi:hypothetical protein